MKEGKFHIGFLVTIILSIVIILMVTTFYGQVFSGTDEDISNLQSCVGLIGALGQGEGKCFVDNRCAEQADVDNTVSTWYGSRWQPIGEGWGCDEVPGHPYCCIETTFYDKDIDVEGALQISCTDKTEPGSIRIVKLVNDIEGCLPLNHVMATLSSEELFGFKYYAKSDEGKCQINVKLLGKQDSGLGVRTVDCKKGGMDIEMGGVTLSQIVRSLRYIDVGELNDATAIQVEIVEGGETITETVKIDIPTPLCSSIHGAPGCFGKKVGEKTRLSANFEGQPTIIESTCRIVEGYEDKHQCFIDPDYSVVEGYAHCTEVHVGDTIKSPSPCEGAVMPSSDGNMCWVKTDWLTNSIYTCKFDTITACEEVYIAEPTMETIADLFSNNPITGFMHSYETSREKLVQEFPECLYKAVPSEGLGSALGRVGSMYWDG